MKNNNKKGFTLVELVIVVAVMAILVAVAIPTISSIRSSASDSVDKSNAQAIESILKLAEADKETDTALAAGDYQTALENAKLGIKGKTFFYSTDTGDVTVGAGASGANGFTVTYGTDGAVTVS